MPALHQMVPSSNVVFVTMREPSARQLCRVKSRRDPCHPCGSPPANHNTGLANPSVKLATSLTSVRLPIHTD